MKIHADELKGLMEPEQQRKSSSRQPGQAFEQMLNEALSPQTEQASGPAAKPLGGASLDALHTQLRSGLTEAAGSGSSEGQPLLKSVDRVLEQWEKYAEELQSSPSNLKQSYATLKEIGRNLDAVEAALQDQGGQDPALHPILNELQVMAVTEEIKLNRGDYL
jgi:hypothetical protein